MSELASAIYFYGAGSSEKNGSGDIDTLAVKNKKKDQENLVTPPCEYKLPLVWIDLEMTGKLVGWVAWRVFCLFLLK